MATETTLPTQIDLQVVTPERRVVSANAAAVTLPGASGQLGVLPGHAPLVSELSAGVLSYEQEGAKRAIAIGSGFVEVLPGRVIVLAQTAEKPEEIDVERARKAKQRAEENLKRPAATPEQIQEAQAAQDDLNRATARIEVASQAGEITH